MSYYWEQPSAPTTHGPVLVRTAMVVRKRDYWVKLTSDLDPDTHTANAKRGVWDATGDGSLSADTGEEIEVRDTLETRAGGKGCWAWCRDVEAENGTVSEILWINQGLRWYTGTLPSALASSDASKADVVLTDIDAGTDAEAGTGDTVYNPYKCAGPSGAKCLVCDNQLTGHLEFVKVENTTQAVMTAWQYNDTTKNIEKKTRSLAGNWEGTESGWTMVDSTQNC